MAEYSLGTAKGEIIIDGSKAKQGVDEATGAIDNLGNKAGSKTAALGTLSTGLIGVGVAAVGGFAVAVNAAAGFEKELSGFKAVTGSTVEQMEAIRAKALQLGADSAFSAGEAAIAMTELGKAGVSVEGILNGAADATVALAAAGEIDLPEAAKISAAALNQFKLAAEDLPGVADTLAGAANASATGVSEIGLAFEYVGPVAAAAGLSLEDTAGAIALLSNNGIDAGKAGTSLRSILSQLQPTTDKARGAMEELGLYTEESGSAFFDAAGKIKPMNEIVGMLNESMSGLTEEQKLAYAEAMFGREALAAISAIAGTTADEFGELQSVIGDVSAQEVADEKLNNLSGSVEQLKGSMETFMIGAGTPFLGGLKSIVDGLTGLVNWLSGLSPEVQKVAGIVVAAAGSFLLLAGVFLKVGLAVQSFIGLMKTLQVGALLTNPVFLAIAALVALGVALYMLYQRSEGFRDIVQSAFAAIEPAVNAVIGWFKNLGDQLQNLWDVFQSGDDVAQGVAEILDNIFGNTGALVPVIRDVVTWFLNLWNTAQQLWTQMLAGRSVMEFLRDVLAQIGAFITTNVIPPLMAMAAFVTGTLIPFITQLGAVLFNVFQVVLGAVIPFAIGLVTQLVTWFITMLPQIIDTVTHVFNVVRTVIETVMNVVMAIIRQVINVVSALWRAWGDDLINMVGTAWALIQTTIESAIKIVQGIIQTVLALIRGDWGAAWDGIKQVLAGAWDFMVGAVKAAVGLFKGVITGFVSTLIEIWNGLWEKLKGLLSSAWETMKSTTTGAISAVVGFFVGLPGKVLGAIGDLAGTILKFFLTAFAKMKEGAETKFGELVSFLSGLPGKILSAVGDLSRVLLNAGKAIIRGLIEGVESMIGSLTSKLKSVTDLIPNIKGPPKRDAVLLKENGRLIMQGLIAGLTEGFGEVESYLRNVTASIPLSVSAEGVTNVIGSASATAPAAGTTISVGQVVIPAKDLEEMRNVQDFFDRIQQVARQGV